MLHNIRKFSKTFLAKIVLVIMIVPFVLWGMGGVFNSGNTNNVAKINNKSISTQDFMNFLNNSNIDTETVRENLENNVLEQLVSTLISEKLLEMEIKDLNLKISEKSLAKNIRKNPNFFDENNKFSRIKYEKFLLENNITAPDFEIRFRNEELKKKLFAYIGGGIKSPYFLNNKIYINKNKEVEIKYLDLDTVYNTETPETEIEQFIKDNEENLKEEVIDFSYAKITPSNLIDSDEFNNEFFKKIDEIENSILNDSSIEDIRKIYDLKIEYLSNYNNEDKNNEIFKEIYEKRNDEKIQLLDKNDYYLLFEVTKINKVLPSKSEIKFIERVKENLILKKKYEYNKDLFQKIQDKKFNNDEFVKISKNGENLLNETIKSLDDNSIFDKDSVSLIYSLPENSFVLLTNDNNKIFLAKVNKIYTKNLPKNDIENSEYLEISNNKIVEEIYSSYDLALSKKYKVKVFQNTLDRIKNNFK